MQDEWKSVAKDWLKLKSAINSLVYCLERRGLEAREHCVRGNFDKFYGRVVSVDVLNILEVKLLPGSCPFGDGKVDCCVSCMSGGLYLCTEFSFTPYSLSQSVSRSMNATVWDIYEKSVRCAYPPGAVLGLEVTCESMRLMWKSCDSVRSAL